MATKRCAVCGKEDSTSNMYYCSNCDLWVHFYCAGGHVGIIASSDASCPSCRKALKKS
jgi:rubrerythrin